MKSFFTMRSRAALLALVPVGLVLVTAASAQGSPAGVAVHSRAVSSHGRDTTDGWNTAAAPKAIRRLTNIAMIAAGNGSNYAIDTSGQVWAWGGGWNGALGQGNTTNHRNVAVSVVLPAPMVTIGEAFNSAIAVTAGGQPYGWGSNRQGQLCTGDTVDHQSPVELTNLSHISAVVGGGGHYIFLTSSGTMLACGTNAQGQLGDGTFAASDTPVSVDLSALPDSPIEAISAGNDSSAILLEDGEVWDWGSGTHGELGNGTTADSDVPVQVSLPGPAVEVYAGGDLPSNGQSLALLASGAVYGWGADNHGQLGNGITTPTESTPVEATALPPNITAVAEGGTSGMVLDASGNVWTFGAAGDGNVLTPVKVLSGADHISSTADDDVAHVS